MAQMDYQSIIQAQLLLANTDFALSFLFFNYFVCVHVTQLGGRLALSFTLWKSVK